MQKNTPFCTELGLQRILVQKTASFCTELRKGRILVQKNTLFCTELRRRGEDFGAGKRNINNLSGC